MCCVLMAELHVHYSKQLGPDMYLLYQAPKPVPEAVKQGVETPGKKSKGGDEGGGKVTANKATSSPQFEAFIRRIRGGK